MAQAPKDARSTLRKVFDLAERAVAARAEPLAQSGGFATALSKYVAINRSVGRTLSKATSGVLHLVNIPTTTDVARIHEHLNAVDSQLSRLTRELEKRPPNRQSNPSGRGKSRRTAKDPVEPDTSEEG